MTLRNFIAGAAIVFAGALSGLAQAEEVDPLDKYADFFGRLDACLMIEGDPVCEDVAKEIYEDSEVTRPLESVIKTLRTGQQCVKHSVGHTCAATYKLFVRGAPKKDNKKSAAALYFLSKGCDLGRKRVCDSFERNKAALAGLK